LQWLPQFRKINRLPDGGVTGCEVVRLGCDQRLLPETSVSGVDLLAAMHDATQPGFDPVREYDTRYREEELRYAKKMADSRETANHLTKEVLEDSPPTRNGVLNVCQ